VLAAGAGKGEAARQALAALCRDYWYPLYAFARRQGRQPHDAEELTQQFFAWLLERNWFGAADPGRGRFRSFLLTSFQHFLANQRDRAQAAQRGGGRRHLPLETGSAEQRYQHEPSHDLTAERLYERRWALELLEHALARLRADYARRGQLELYELLCPSLVGDDGGRTPGEGAALLGMTPGAVKTAAHRLRRRYREVLRSLIADTVACPDEVDAELGELLAVLARPGNSAELL
jgi:RNA polymerase sigma-70 factor (ECF subfamily)